MMMVVLLAGLFIASYGGKLFGWPGFLLGVPVGVFVAFGVLYAVALLWASIEALLWDGMPYMPTCGNGKCKSGLLTDFGDYEPEHDDEFRAYFRCKCGRLYWRNRKEGRVLEVLSDGTVKPYMKWKSFRGWRPDSEPVSSAGRSANDVSETDHA